MSMKRTCPISNFTSASEGMPFSYHDLRNLTRSEVRGQKSEIGDQRSRREVEARETRSLQFPVERRHFLRDDFFPAFREHGGLVPDIVYRCFDAIGGPGVDSLNLCEEIFGRIQSVQRRSRIRSAVWRSQFLQLAIQRIQFFLDVFRERL